jgi:DNA-binding MarR family transcriptional regulator
MKSELLLKLLEYWAAYSKERLRGSLAEFAAWMLTKECESELLSEDLSDVEKIKLKIFEIAQALETDSESSLKFNEFRILSEVQKRKKSNKQTIVSDLSFDNSTGFYFIKSLIKKKLLQQDDDPSDGRAKVISLTEKGRSELGRVRRDFATRVPIHKLARNSRDRKTFITTLNSIYSIEKNSRTK